MAATSPPRPQPLGISLQSNGFLDDDVPEDSSLLQEEKQQHLTGVLSELNGLAAKRTSSPTKPAWSRKAEPVPEWGVQDELELEEEMAREEQQRRDRLREMEKECPAPPPDFEGEDDEELEALRMAELSNRVAASSFISTMAPAELVLEDNGLLGLGNAEAGPSSPKRPLLPPLPVLSRDESPENRSPGYTVNQASSSSQPNLIPLPSATRFTRTAPEASIPKYIPAGHFSAISLDGNVVRFEKRRRLRGWKAPPPHYGEATSTGLLSRPVHQIIDSIKAQEAERVVAAGEEAEARAKALLMQQQENMSARNSKTPGMQDKDDTRVWVERYRPKRFAELLGDERIHREVMGWLKEWDPCVFRRKNRRRTKEFGATTGPGNHQFGVPPAEYKDPYDRPQQRVLLISGPPGLGKTTLAHVLAKAAGYGVYELNASDARTTGAVTDTIKTALESASLKDSRPTCLVVDEIDGATGGGQHSEESRGFIKALVDLIENGKGSASDKKQSKNKKTKKHKPVLRPIICICNDLYASALRPLRPHCRLVRFQKPAQNHLVSRLKAICEAESLSASSRSLSLLAELAQGDIRSCLNALQMAKHKRARLLVQEGSIELTEKDIREAGVGVKDGSTNLQSVWTALFKTASPKERARKTSPHEGPALTQHLVSLAQSSGEYTRLLQGCFEHYPSLHFVDDGWWRIRNVLGWVDWGLDLQDKAFMSSHFELMGYVPYSFVKWNHLFANTVNPLPEWPKADYENHLKRQAFDEIAVELQSALSPSLRAQFGRDSVIRELGPTLMRMLTPDLKPVNQQIVRAAERETVNHLVDIMLHLSLNFVRERTEDGSLVYKLDPPLEVFTSFAGKQSAAVKTGRYAVRQIVMKELETERIKRRAPAQDAEGKSGATAASIFEAYRQHDAKMGGAEGTGGKKAKVALDFFGRPIVPKIKQPPSSATSASKGCGPDGGHGVSGKQDATIVVAGADEDKEGSLPASILAARRARAAQTLAQAASNVRPAEEEANRSVKRLKVHYRYNEGYSNAVRQPIKMSSLL